jgi:hypothetical protein
MVKDVRALLTGDGRDGDGTEAVYLWDTHGLMANGINYAGVGADEKYRADGVKP